jgi:flagellar protein FliO/FliZ
MTGGIAATSVLGVALALVVVLALAWGSIRLLKAWQDRQAAMPGLAGPPLRFVRALPLGQRERVVLMEAEGERLLLGVTPGGISLLARWPLP